MDLKFVLALELRVLKQEGSSFEIRFSIYVLKGCYKETPQKLAITLSLVAKAFLPLQWTRQLTMPEKYPQHELWFLVSVVDFSLILDFFKHQYDSTGADYKSKGRLVCLRVLGKFKV